VRKRSSQGPCCLLHWQRHSRFSKAMQAYAVRSLRGGCKLRRNAWEGCFEGNLASVSSSIAIGCVFSVSSRFSDWDVARCSGRALKQALEAMLSFTASTRT
jgi:hypothetical protein